jgi:hypothetical protein
MATKNLTVELIGDQANGGDIGLVDLRDYLANLANCLKLVEEKIPFGSRLDYRIVGLRHGSAVMRIHPVGKEGDTKKGPKVLGLFTNTIKALEAGIKVDRRINGPDLLAFKKLAQPLSGRLTAVRFNKKKITPQFTAHIDQILGSAILSEGSVRGKVEKLNLHNRNEFTLYPIIGRPVACTFPPELYGKVLEALKSSATVYGRLTYFLASPFPDKASVFRIEVNAPDDSLPRLSEMRGVFKDRLGGRTAVEFVRAIRNEQVA